MTVAELRQALQGVPDDYGVVLRTGADIDFYAIPSKFPTGNCKLVILSGIREIVELTDSSD